MYLCSNIKKKNVTITIKIVGKIFSLLLTIIVVNNIPTYIHMYVRILYNIGIQYIMFNSKTHIR